MQREEEEEGGGDGDENDVVDVAIVGAVRYFLHQEFTTNMCSKSVSL